MVKLQSVMIFLLGIYCTYATALSSPSSLSILAADTTQNENIYLSPEGLIPHTVDENVSLTFLATWDDPIPGLALAIDPYNLPQGSTMPPASGASPDTISTTFNWVPAYCQSGSYDFYVAYYTNNELQDEDTHRVTVTNVNRLPSITTPLPIVKYLAVGSNWNQAITATDLDLTECADDTLTMSYTYNPTPITASFFDHGGGNAVFDWTPSAGEVGIHTLTFKVEDEHGGISTKQVFVEVYQPRGTATFTIPEGQSFSFLRSVAGFEAESLKIEPLQSALPAGASFPIRTGTTALSDIFSWKPSYCQQSTVPYSFTVKYWGSDQNYDTETININVINANRAPQFSNTPCYFKARGGRDTVTFDFTVTDQDELCSPSEEAAPLRLTSMGNPYNVGGVIKNSQTNVYTYLWKPDKMDVGSHTVTFTATDSHGAVTTKKVQVYVLRQNAVLSPSDMVAYCRSSTGLAGDIGV